MLEYFVHIDKDDPPRDLVLAIAEVPADVAPIRIKVDQLPATWRELSAPPELTKVGDDFAQAGNGCLLFIPSVLAPNENNCLINPAHPDFRKLVMKEPEPLSYDSRMFSRRGH